ncbi:hypothetical protein ACFX2A_004031 [Malus domestica]
MVVDLGKTEGGWSGVAEELEGGREEKGEGGGGSWRDKVSGFGGCRELRVGTLCVDFLASVASYPNPDDKIKTTSFKVQAGGNAGNAITCAARLGLRAGLVVDDTQGRAILQELQADSVDTSFVVVSFNWKAIYKFEYPFGVF